MIYLHSGGGDSTKQRRVNQAATDKAQQIAQDQQSLLYTISSESDFPTTVENIGTILLIEPTIELALEVCRRYQSSTEIVMAESAVTGAKLTVCQIEFEVIKICVI
ncbi:TPA: hypothetical protein QIB97_003364 [Proteus mirabilis]|nr:hypothetical protein [Proteus mirabilis]